MAELTNDNGFLEEDFQDTLDTLRIREKSREVVEDLETILEKEYGGNIESALLTRSGHYGMSLMADSALMQDKFGFEPGAQEVADMDLCVTVSSDIEEEIPEIRSLFKKEDSTQGRINQEYEGIEINPRILSEGELIGKLEKSVEEWRTPGTAESVTFPNVEGETTTRNPVEFMGYFHEGYTAIKITDNLESALNYVHDTLTNEEGEVQKEIYDDVWDDFRSRIDFKPGSMEENGKIGRVELAKTNSQRLDYGEDRASDESLEREYGDPKLSQKLKDDLLDNENVLEWFEGESPYEVGPAELDQSQLDYEGMPEPETSPEKEIIRRRVFRYLEDHEDIEKGYRNGEYQFHFGGESIKEYFGDDALYNLAENAARSELGRRMASENASEEESRDYHELSDF